MDKRPGSALKQQRKDSGRQNRGAGPGGGQDQANLKLERIKDARSCRGALVRLCGVSESAALDSDEKTSV